MFKYTVLILCLIIFGLPNETESQTGPPDCYVNFGTDSGTTPLVLNYDWSIAIPNYYGTIILSRFGSHYTLACPGGRLYPHGLNSYGQGTICRGGYSFNIRGNTISYDIVRCILEDHTRPAFVELYNNPDIHCETGNFGTKAVQVGYNIRSNNEENFIPVYLICFSYLETPLYSKYKIVQNVLGGHNYLPPPQYLFYLDLYANGSPLDAYENINNKFEELGLQAYINDINFLTQGQLADYEDFYYQSQRDATYNIANTAPQWNSFDQGNWKTLENGIVKLVGGGTTGDAIVLTGTLKVTTLTNSTGHSVEIYLSEYSTRIPVPRWFWKLVYFSKSNFGAIFFGYNNPFDQKFNVDAEFLNEICYADIFPTLQSSWLLKDIVADDASLGYMYACPLKTVMIIDPLISEIVGNVIPEAKSEVSYIFPGTGQVN